MKALGDMGPLVIGALAPLAATSAKHEPTALALGTFLSLLLGRMTFNLQPEPVVYDLVREQTALKSLMITVTSIALFVCRSVLCTYTQRFPTTRALQNQLEATTTKTKCPLLLQNLVLLLDWYIHACFHRGRLV
jgi:hypothetical protein